MVYFWRATLVGLSNCPWFQILGSPPGIFSHLLNIIWSSKGLVTEMMNLLPSNPLSSLSNLYKNLMAELTVWVSMGKWICSLPLCHIVEPVSCFPWKKSFNLFLGSKVFLSFLFLEMKLNIFSRYKFSLCTNSGRQSPFLSYCRLSSFIRSHSHPLNVFSIHFFKICD